MVVNLGFLALFKYFDFFVGSAESALREIGLNPSGLELKVILPVGIGFYTFQSLSYTIDVYRRQDLTNSPFLGLCTLCCLFSADGSRSN